MTYLAGEFVPRTMYCLRSERNLVSFERTLAEKLIEKGIFVAFPLTVARNEASETAFLYRDLDEFTFSHKGVHSGDLARQKIGRCYARRGGLAARLPHAT